MGGAAFSECEQIDAATGRGDEPPGLTAAPAVQLQSSGIWLTFWGWS